MTTITTNDDICAAKIFKVFQDEGFCCDDKWTKHTILEQVASLVKERAKEAQHNTMRNMTER